MFLVPSASRVARAVLAVALTVMTMIPAVAQPAPPSAPAAPLPSVDDFVRFALEHNPRLSRAAFVVDAARGRFIQAGLYPNPILTVTGEEIGDRQGPGGIWTAPLLSQEIVTGRKLTLSQTIAAREVDRAALDLMAERYTVVGAVRSSFYEVLALQERVKILDELVGLAYQMLSESRDSKKLSRLDIVQLETELARLRADAESVRQEIPAAYRRLAAVVGEPRLPVQTLTGMFVGPASELAVPYYELERTRDTVLAVHPEVTAARVAVTKAQAALQRARAEPIPNVTVSSGYIRQNQNRSNDWSIGVSIPVPVWNRNQGNIRASQAEIGVAIQDAGRVENELTARIATVFRTYSSARKRAEQYKPVLDRAEEAYAITRQGFPERFTLIQVIQVQRALFDARLEYYRALGEAWRAAGEISGFLLEESWPTSPPVRE